MSRFRGILIDRGRQHLTAPMQPRGIAGAGTRVVLRCSWVLAAIMLAGGLSACSSGGDTADSIPHYPRFIQDDQGRVLLLRGLNIMSHAKSDPLRMPNLDASEIRRMRREWGHNFVRFLIFWDALEPQPGTIDQAYLDRVQDWLDLFEREGMHVMLDMHQDVYAARFCCDGAPEWAIRDDGEPFTLQPSWALNYLQPAVMRAFDHFWRYDGPHGDLQDHYADAWRAVARRFKDHPAVMGYDIMNEPHPGSMIDGLELFGTPNPSGTHATFDRDLFQPFYQRMIDAIRSEDTDGYIGFEPRYGAPGNGLPSYLGVLTDPRDPDRLMYVPHLYSLLMEVNSAYDPRRDQFLEKWVVERTREQNAQQCPILIGEWGFDGDWGNAELLTTRILDTADQMLAGWAYWSADHGGWGFIQGDGTDHERIQWMTRPWPLAVAGEPLRLGYDPSSRTMTLQYRPPDENSEILAPHEFFVPRSTYPDGYQLGVLPENTTHETSWNSETQTLSVRVSSTSQDVTITVGPPSALP